MKCYLCGFDFVICDKTYTCKKCFLNKKCLLIKCPNCGYSVPKEFDFLKNIKLFINKIFIKEKK